MVSYHSILLCLNMVTIGMMLETILLQRQRRMFPPSLMLSAWLVLTCAIVLTLFNALLWVTGRWELADG